MVYTILNLAYSKGYVYYMLLIYNMTLLFWNFLHPSVECDHMTMTCDSVRYMTSY